MASNQTPNYALNQWELSDSVIMADFNADNQKVDAALATLNDHIDTTVADATQKTDTALATLSKRLDTAVANTTQAVNTLTQTLSAVQAAIPHVQVGSYVGTGTWGPDNPNTLTFDFTPKLVIVNDFIPGKSYDDYAWARFFAVYGTPVCCLDHSRRTYTPNPIYLTWGEKSLTWYSPEGNASHQANVTDITYHYIAIG